MIGKILEITFILILSYLVIANATNFSIAIRSIGSVYTGSVKTLQGR